MIVIRYRCTSLWTWYSLWHGLSILAHTPHPAGQVALHTQMCTVVSCAYTTTLTVVALAGCCCYWLFGYMCHYELFRVVRSVQPDHGAYARSPVHPTLDHVAAGCQHVQMILEQREAEGLVHVRTGQHRVSADALVVHRVHVVLVLVAKVQQALVSVVRQSGHVAQVLLHQLVHPCAVQVGPVDHGAGRVEQPPGCGGVEHVLVHSVHHQGADLIVCAQL